MKRAIIFTILDGFNNECRFVYVCDANKVDETIEYAKNRNTEIIKYEVCGIRFHNMTIDGVEYSSL